MLLGSRCLVVLVLGYVLVLFLLLVYYCILGVFVEFDVDYYCFFIIRIMRIEQNQAPIS